MELLKRVQGKNFFQRGGAEEGSNKVKPAAFQLLFNRSDKRVVIPKRALAPFVLRNINPHEIRENFIAGHYNNLSIAKSPVYSAPSDIISRPDTNDRCQEKFYETNNGRTTMKVTLGQKDFAKGIEMNDRPFEMTPRAEGHCIWCRKNLAKLEGILPLPIPIGLRRKANSYIFATSPLKACCFGCAFCRMSIDSKLKRHIPLLRLLFNLLHPDKELYKSNDWELHMRNNGPLDDSEFYNSRYFYYQSPNVILSPTKTEYGIARRQFQT